MAEEDLPEDEAAEAGDGDDAEDAEDAGPPADEDGDDDDYDDYDFDDDDDLDGEGGGLSKRLIIIAGAALVAIIAIAGGAIFFLGGDGGQETAASKTPGIQAAGSSSSRESRIPRVVLALPPRSGGARRLGFGRAGLAPPPPQPQGGQIAAAGGTESQAAGPAPRGLNAIGAGGAGALGPGSGVIVPAVTLASFANLPARAEAEPLAAAPDPALVEKTAAGPLPKIGEDGRQPWRVYARPFSAAAGVPRIAIIVTGLGLSQAATRTAIERLPAAVTLAFHPSGSDLENLVAAARRAGHEVLMSVPMEPQDFPASDPGPLSLRIDLGTDENIERLNTVLGRASGYVGVLEIMGSRFTTSEDSLKPVLDVLKKRGLLYVDGGSAPDSRAPDLAAELGLPAAEIILKLDAVASRTAIDARLGQLEQDARRDSIAVASVRPLPVSLDRLVAWISTLEQKRLVLAPVSAVVAAPKQ